MTNYIMIIYVIKYIYIDISATPNTSGMVKKRSNKRD